MAQLNTVVDLSAKDAAARQAIGALYCDVFMGEWTYFCAEQQVIGNLTAIVREAAARHALAKMVSKVEHLPGKKRTKLVAGLDDDAAESGQSSAVNAELRYTAPQSGVAASRAHVQRDRTLANGRTS